MRVVFLFLLIVINASVFAQKNAPSIVWNENTDLTWNDFKARPNKVSHFKALTSTSISLGVNYENTTLTIDITNEFYPKKSWTKVEGEKSQNLLAHESLHFDISELFARKLRQKVLETKFKSRGQKLINEISSLYQETMRELEKVQRAYDKETDHSVKKEIQDKWELKIKKQLNELNKYSESTIVLQVK